MPSQVRIIQQRNSAEWGNLIQDVIKRDAYGQEHFYFGVTDPERADKIRRALRTAGKRLQVGTRVYWSECTGCTEGGADCRFHVNYTVFDMEQARAYMAQQSAKRSGGRTRAS
jgi:hypothetical protein